MLCVIFIGEVSARIEGLGIFLYFEENKTRLDFFSPITLF
jgi:hypothetical protein